MTPEEAAERRKTYELGRRVRTIYLDVGIGEKFKDAIRRGKAGGQGTYSECDWITGCWMPPAHLKDLAHGEDAGAHLPVPYHQYTYRLDHDAVSYWVTCEGFLVDKWWKENARDVSGLGRRDLDPY